MVSAVRTDVEGCDKNWIYITSPVQNDRIYFNDKGNERGREFWSITNKFSSHFEVGYIKELQYFYICIYKFLEI